MLNEDKVRLMSRMAMFETREGKEAIKIEKYTKKDYIFIQVIKTWVLSTIGFALVFLLALLLCIDFISVVLSAVNLSIILIAIVALYAACVILSVMYARKEAVSRYEEAKRLIKKYRKYVDELDVMYSDF